MPVRLIATDLDGTLLHSDNTVSARTREAMAAAEGAGLVVAFVTGRPPRWLHEVAQATGHNGIAVAANGALLYDLHDESVVGSHLLEPATLDVVTHTLRRTLPNVHFAVEYGLDFAYEPEYSHDWEVLPVTDRHGREMPRAVLADLEELIRQPAVKLLAKDRDAVPDPFMDEVETLVGDEVTVTRSGHSALVEISAQGVTKASGLAELAARYGIDAADVVAIGDMPNDVPMLRWAGRSFAVSNAHRSARAAADEIVASNDEDAVAALIEAVLDGALDRVDDQETSSPVL